MKAPAWLCLGLKLVNLVSVDIQICCKFAKFSASPLLKHFAIIEFSPEFLPCEEIGYK